MEPLIPYQTIIGPATLNSPLLRAIKALGRANAKTLGFLPDAAFDHYADKGLILCATSPEGELVGYLMYRTTEDRWAKVVHLCVVQTHRRKGIGRELFKELDQRTQHLRGIYLRSRRDFPGTAVWPKMGLAAVHEIAGRSRRGTTLTVWVYEREQPGLFTVRRPLIEVAIDLNILYDLHVTREVEVESQALLADWLRDEIRLCVTPEIYNEIVRLLDPADRKTRRGWASRFDRIAGPHDEFERAWLTLEEIFGHPRNDQAASDLRHLAYSVAGGLHFFITRDNDLLNHATEIEARVGLTVLRPTALVLRLDEMRRELNYYPVRLRGSQARVKRVSFDEIDHLSRLFAVNAQRETYSQLRDKLNSLLSTPAAVHGEAIYDEAEPVALVVTDTRTPMVMDIPILRLRRSPLAPTIIRHALMRAVEGSVQLGLPATTISERNLSSQVLDALAQSTFEPSEGLWIKINLLCAAGASEITCGLRTLRGHFEANGSIRSVLDQELDAVANLTSVEDAAQLERRLWPAKVLDAGMANFIVPIKATWAQTLFDERLAQQYLFETEARLILNSINVYYRSPVNTAGLVVPCRILWYVSKHNALGAEGQVRACSQGLQVEVLPAREAYKRFQRLGTYSWKNVLDTAAGNPDDPVMVIQFHLTEQFANPVRYRKVRQVVEVFDGKRPVLQGPARISDRSFAAIYEQGCRVA